jgi:carboxyl-terminal processing protease
MANGAGVKLTTARWYTPSGRSIDRVRHSNAEPPGTEDAAPEFHTKAGRSVRGGGGIAPDIVLPEVTSTPGELALQASLGKRITEFRDALTAFATTQRGALTSWDSPVTSAVLNRAWASIRDRGFDIDRATYDGASRLVASFLGREMVRLSLGPAAEARRIIAQDTGISRAAALLRDAQAPGDVFRGIAPGMEP